MTGTDYVQLVIAGGTAGGSLGLVLVAVKWTANFIAGRLDKKEERVDAASARVDAATQNLIQQLTDEGVRLYDRLTIVERGLAECKEEHAQCRAQVMELKGLIQGRGDARNDAARIVAADRVADKRKPRDES